MDSMIKHKWRDKELSLLNQSLPKGSLLKEGDIIATMCIMKSIGAPLKLTDHRVIKKETTNKNVSTKAMQYTTEGWLDAERLVKYLGHQPSQNE